MRFEWDDAKSEANLRERGFDFEFAYTDRQDGRGEVLRRIISSHRSNRRERTIYEKATKRA